MRAHPPLPRVSLVGRAPQPLSVRAATRQFCTHSGHSLWYRLRCRHAGRGRWRLVVGVDLSPATVREAGRDHAGPGRSFVAANGVRLPFAAATFELIVSFETLEHISASDLFLAELRRVLRPDGVLLLSTPNRDYTETNGQVCVNPFHLREYSRMNSKTCFPGLSLASSCSASEFPSSTLSRRSILTMYGCDLRRCRDSASFGGKFKIGCPFRSRIVFTDCFSASRSIPTRSIISSLERVWRGPPF